MDPSDKFLGVSRFYLGETRERYTDIILYNFLSLRIFQMFVVCPSIFQIPHHQSIILSLPSRKLTYPIKNGTFEDDFPFPQVQVGCVSSLEGNLNF